MVRVIIVEDEPLFRGLLETSLRASGLEVVGSFADAEDLIAQTGPIEADVLLVDLMLGSGADGIVLGNTLLERNPHLSCVLLTSSTSDNVLRRLQLQPGSRWSLLGKSNVGDVDQLRSVLESAAAGIPSFDHDPSDSIQSSLLPIQRRILEFVAAGASNTAIAQTLNISTRAVEGHISRAFVALGIDASDPTVNARVLAAARLLSGAEFG